MALQTNNPPVPVTPFKVYLRDHFASVLQQSRPAKPRQKDPISYREHGEVLTADEVYERLEKEEEERRKRKKKQTKKSSQASTRATAKRKQKSQQRDAKDDNEESDHGALDFCIYMG